MNLFERPGGKLLACEDIIDFDGCTSFHSAIVRFDVGKTAQSSR